MSISWSNNRSIRATDPSALLRFVEQRTRAGEQAPAFFCRLLRRGLLPGRLPRLPRRRALPRVGLKVFGGLGDRFGPLESCFSRTNEIRERVVESDDAE